MRTPFLLLLLFISLHPVAAVTTISEGIPQKEKHASTESAFLRFLGPTILEIMEKHGDNQLYMNEQIESITFNEQEDSYDVTLHVVGFEGAHNPPYNFIQMVIRIPGRKNNTGYYDVISYKKHLVDSVDYKK
ncbi:hypothetical protein CHI02_02235 [Niallia circulans]|uniref:DUF3888 domain-containing protein n=1 Tax=Niallia circulans TaxID=1397 RepID=UPI000BA73DD9|nr:DUF3888 domain-containing protein [Niallia circulans]PAE13896.1 hypothetical protein CHI02_02235 [Niallia circulans]